MARSTARSTASMATAKNRQQDANMRIKKLCQTKHLVLHMIKYDRETSRVFIQPDVLTPALTFKGTVHLKTKIHIFILEIVF